MRRVIEFAGAASLAVLLIASCAPGPRDAARSGDQWANYRANALFERAEQYYAAARYSEAINDYREYLDKYQDIHKADDAAFRIAQSLEALGQRIEAADAYRATGLAWSKTSLAPSAFLRAGELYELEGWLRDAKLEYERCAEYLSTEPGKVAFQRLIEVKAKIAEEEAVRRERRRSLRDDANADAVRISNMREWPPAERTVYDLIMRR